MAVDGSSSRSSAVVERRGGTIPLASFPSCAPLDRQGMSREEAEETARLFKLLGDPARVQVLNLLAASDQAVCVCHLTDLLGRSQPTVSFHMRKLVDAGLLHREQRGVLAYYSLHPDAKRRLGAVLTLRGGRR